MPGTLCLLSIALIILLGFGLRVAWLDKLPLSLSLDESVDGLDALQLLRTHWLTPFLQNYFGRETLFFYVQSLALWLYGINQFSLRFAAVVVGTLTIPLLYVVSRQLKLDELIPSEPVRPLATAGDYRRYLIGLLAAIGLATSYWHMYFSRLGQRAIVLPLLLLCLVWCFWRGWQFSSPLRTPVSPLRGEKQGTTAEGSGTSAPQTPAHKRRYWLAAAGALLGLSLYTYLAARMLPFLFGLFIAVELLRDRKAFRTKLIDTLVLVSVAALVSIPLFVYFFNNPQAFGGRTGMISIFNQSAVWQTLANNLLRLVWIHLGGGSWLAQWPSLNLLMGLGFLSGLLSCCYRIRRPAALFLLLWWSVGFVPVLLSQQEWERVTTIQRGIVAWPAVYLISATGLWAVAGLIARHVDGLRRDSPLSAQEGWRLWPAVVSPLAETGDYRCLRKGAVLLLLALGFGIGQDAHHYFFTWAHIYDRSEDDAEHIAGYLNRQTTQMSLTPSRFYANPIYNFLLQVRYPTLANIEAGTLRSLLAPDGPADARLTRAVYLMPHETISPAEVLSFVLLVPSADGGSTAYLLPPLTPTQAESLRVRTEESSPLTTILNGQEEPIAAVYPLPADAPFLPDEPLPVQPIQARFGNDVLLTGYLAEPAIVPPAHACVPPSGGNTGDYRKPSESVSLYLRFQALRWIDGDYAMFVHVFDSATGQRWAEVDTTLGGATSLNAHRWPPGLIVLDLQQFQLPLNAPDGVYRFEVGIYHRPSERRLPVMIEDSPLAKTGDQRGRSDDKLILGKFRVMRQAMPVPQYPLNVQFEDNIALSGLDVARSSAAEIALTLYWQALTSIPTDYTVFVHLLDEQGNLHSQHDSMPRQGRYPTSLWSPGETIPDVHNLALRADMPPGDYTVRVGLYDLHTGQRLPLKNQAADTVDLPISIPGNDSRP